MNPVIAVLLCSIGAVLLLVAVGVAVLAMRNERQQRLRTDAIVRERAACDDALRQLAEVTIPAIGDAVRRGEPPTAAVEVPASMRDSQFAQLLQWIAGTYADDLARMRGETAATVEHIAAERTAAQVHAAEQAVRAEIGDGARTATSAAVRSFGTSVVSLGADVSQVVSTALREHRNDEVYGTLTRIDHTVQQMIRQAQSYVIISGGLPGRRWPQQSLTDLIGGATGRVRDYLRVRAGQCERMVISRAVEPLVHTMATLLDNALRYSPPASFVDVTFQEGHHGVTVIIDDAGVRMSPEQLEDARQILTGERPVDIHDLGPSPKVGFPGVAALARRYGFSVHIDGPNIYGGMRAMVYIPESLLVNGDDLRVPEVEGELYSPPPAPVPTSAPAPAAPRPIAAPAAPAVVTALPVPEPEAAVHEITEGGLPKRRRRAVAPVAGATSGPHTEPGPARADLAAAWHSGSRSGRAAAAQRSTEGKRS
ncbi:ATP-binding protein [Nocardia thailandica]|uniref:histidine kinase n=1 Tax=Nocardia thailandica TaxID=257275 RepID=A0ABW6PN30_9NOCA